MANKGPLAGALLALPRVADQNEAASAADAARVGDSAHAQIHSAFAQEGAMG
jgi:hypothetical protein